MVLDHMNIDFLKNKIIEINIIKALKPLGVTLDYSGKTDWNEINIDLLNHKNKLVMHINEGTTNKTIRLGQPSNFTDAKEEAIKITRLFLTINLKMRNNFFI